MSKAFIATIYNEQDSIESFLNSLLAQTEMPNEIIIVDGGSKDKTISILKSYLAKFSKNQLKVYVKKGNRSVGRNYAITKARSEIIAVSDAGCILDKKWFEIITKPFENEKVDVVAGFYKPLVKSVFEKSLAAYTCFPADKLTSDFLPSSRSVAFAKSAWEKVGGYPEYLDTCEDLVFAKKMKDIGLKFEVCKKALVMWPQKSNLIEAYKQFYSYARGDGQALYIRPQTPLLYARYILAIAFGAFILLYKDIFYCYIFIFLTLAYLAWAVVKNYKYVGEKQAIIFLPMLQIISDIAVLAGTSIGIFKKISS